MPKIVAAFCMSSRASGARKWLFFFCEACALRMLRKRRVFRENEDVLVSRACFAKEQFSATITPFQLV
jgi:hypothetical protein